jgi:hypothetical protein
MGKIYARLIYNYQTYGTDTKYKTLADVPEKHQEATRVAYFELYGMNVPEE